MEDISPQGVHRKTGPYSPGRLAHREGKEHWGIWHCVDGKWHLAVKGFLPVDLVSSGKSARRIKKSTHADTPRQSLWSPDPLATAEPFPSPTIDVSMETSSPPDVGPIPGWLAEMAKKLDARGLEYNQALAKVAERERLLEEALQELEKVKFSEEEMAQLKTARVAFDVLASLMAQER